jgi:predicted O-methyltransferase YrrM
MISPEECKYYRWLGRFFTGAGAVVELGPWLGCSTVHILAGLERSPGFRDRRLHVFDDFVWRSSWMDRHLPARRASRDVPLPRLSARVAAAATGR